MVGKSCVLDLGGIRLSIAPEHGCELTADSMGALASFVVDGPGDVSIRLSGADPETPSSGVRSFRSGSRWEVYETPCHTRIVAFGGTTHRERILLYDHQKRAGVLYWPGGPLDDVELALAYPLLEILYTKLLAAEDGILVHACAIQVAGKGLAFAGKSGAGKSTTARLWLQQGQGEVLCDDRVIIRKGSEGFRVYGTPWHGDIPAVSPTSVPLRRLYFLRHSEQCQLALLSPAAASSRLLQCVFATWWDPEGMASTLRFVEELVREVPCFELAFVPEPTAVDFVLEQIEGRSGR